MQLRMFAAVVIFAATGMIGASNGLEPMIGAAGEAHGVGNVARATLQSLRDSYRPLLIFAPTNEDWRLLQQAQLLAGGRVQLQNRQVAIVALSYKKGTVPSGVIFNSAQTVEFSQDEALKARERFGVAPGEFTVILIGKDGGEKFRSHTPVTIERLNTVIDAMPMRQQEVRNGNSK